MKMNLKHHRSKEGTVLLVSVLLVLFLAAPAISYGHTFYIQSSRYHVHKGKQSPMFFCYGHHVPFDDGMRGEKIKSLRVYKPSTEVRQVQVRDETGLHSYMVEYDSPGTWVLAAETNPGFYTVYTDKKGREHHVVKPKSAVLDKADSIKTSLLSKQYAKSYVVCETPSAEFSGRIGLGLELVPARDPGELKPGDQLELKVYFNGTPYIGKGAWDGTYNGFSTESEDSFHPRTQVSGDSFRVPLPNPGRWFVRYSIEIEAEGKDREQYSHMKHTSTLVFQIPNERKRPGAESH